MRAVTACKNFVESTTKDGCIVDKLVGIEPSLEKAVDFISQVGPIFASTRFGGERCSPIVCVRHARGGKSTFLRLLLDKLQKSGKFAPILISFNGGFARRSDESARDAIVRMIACEFIDIDNEAEDSSQVVCDQKELLQHIKNSSEGKTVVLMIDELNQLEPLPLSPEASNFLKLNFLDAENRALIFSSHLPIDMEYAQKGTSYRESLFVPLLKSMDLSQLRVMADHCANLTPLEAAMYGYNPALIYSMKKSVAPIFSRVSQAGINIPEDGTERLILGAFVRQLLDGKVRVPDDALPWLKIVRKFDIFGSTPNIGIIEFPILFIAAILNLFPSMSGFNLEVWLMQLVADAARIGGGKDWEMIAQFALMLHCVETSVRGFQRATDCPINFLGKRQKVKDLEFRCVSLPGHLMTPDQAKSWLDDLFSKVAGPTLLMAVPTHSSFAIFDSIVALHVPDETTSFIGIQCKLGMDVPSSVSLPEWVEHAYLIRGSAAQKSWHGRDKWTFLSKEDIDLFLGYSLRPLCPKSWEPVY